MTVIAKGTKLPGGPKVRHVMITPKCRRRGDADAFYEAAAHIYRAYLASLAGWRSKGQEPTFHIVLHVEEAK